MITLGIETSCDETAVAILNGRKILSEVVASSARDHAPYGGVVPEIASRRHLESLLPCLDTALQKAKISLERVRLIAVTQGPGLMGSLLVGIAAAKSLGLYLKVPVIPVDHVLAHAFAGQPINRKTYFPFIALVVSGGHTLIIHWHSMNHIQIIGRTFDDAAGEAFDKVAKMMDLGYPGGPVIDRLSQNVSASQYAFPRPWMQKKHYNFSFSGLKTSVLYKIREIQKHRKLTDKDREEIAYAFQEAVCDVLVDKSLRACRDLGAKRIVLGGGVSANSRLKVRFEEAAKRYRVQVHFPERKIALDNATMIALLGQAVYHSRRKRPKRFHLRQLDFRAYSDFFVQKNPIIA